MLTVRSLPHLHREAAAVEAPHPPLPNDLAQVFLIQALSPYQLSLPSCFASPLMILPSSKMAT
jgi:hypothetical protein